MNDRRVIDMECDLPPDEAGKPRAHANEPLRPGGDGPERMPAPEGYGFANYGTIFASRRNNADDQALPGQAGMSLASFVKEMDQAGVEVGVISGFDNRAVAGVAQAFPDRFFGLAKLNPYDGVRAVRELERLVREEGLRGMSVGALYNMIPASDRHYYPLYSKCVELDIPVRIYTAMNYANDRPYDLGHPRHLDQVAIDFPELRISAGLVGWPWANETVGLLRRHPNLYCDTAAHRPRHFATKGSGWEQFLQFGNTLLQDKVMVGLSWTLLGHSLDELIDEYMTLPLKETVKQKWLYGNAARFLGLDK